MKLTPSDIELFTRRIRQSLSQVIVGQEQVTEELILTLFARGHSVLIGVPGLAKTLLIQSLSRTLDLSFSRIQFTPDLMPSDITGTDILEVDPETGKRFFTFVKGPVFASLILADEINRTPPKTQSALLEAMQEKQVTAGGKRLALPDPFFVLATQNPIEQEGTYPLPEAQLDRFMTSLLLTYPTEEQEREVIRRTTTGIQPVLTPVVNREELLAIQESVPVLPASDWLIDRTVRLVTMSRPGTAGFPSQLKSFIRWGAGPRASQALILTAKARAASQGRSTPEWEDVVAMAGPVLRHRLILTFSAQAEGMSPDDVIQSLLNNLNKSLS